MREGRGRFLAIRHVPYFLNVSPQQRLRHFRSMLGLVTCKGGYCPLACVPPVQFSRERLEHSDVSFNYIIHKYETFLFSHTHTLSCSLLTLHHFSLSYTLSLLVTHAAPPWSLSHEYIAKCFDRDIVYFHDCSCHLPDYESRVSILVSNTSSKL